MSLALTWVGTRSYRIPTHKVRNSSPRILFRRGWETIDLHFTFGVGADSS